MRWANEAMTRWRAWDEEWASRLGLRVYFSAGDLILRPGPDPWLSGDM